jgi:hypothetical protein
MEQKPWLLLKKDEQEIFHQYFFLLNEFLKDNGAISYKEKRWILHNANLNTEIYPSVLFENFEMFRKEKEEK